MTKPIRDVTASFPAKVAPIFEKHRYKVLYGGRGGGKSWAVARWLLLEGQQKPIRVICCREHMISIQDSVHRLLCDQIYELGLQDHYFIEKTTIRGRNGTEFRFSGIKHNVAAIKSMEGCTHAWVEEAQTVSEHSWTILIPTIRAEDSEIIITFNPELETDSTMQRFVVNTPPDTALMFFNYTDNPWCPQSLIKEAEHLKETKPDEFSHVYMGQCRRFLEGAVYASELRMAEDEGRITRVPYDPHAAVHAFFDLGYADATAIWFAQRVGFELHLIDYYEHSRRTLDHYLKIVSDKPFPVECIHLPPDAKAKNLGTGQSVEELVRAKGRATKIVPSLSLSDGINAVRQQFPNIWIDKERCIDGLTALRHYRYELQVSEKGGFKNEPVHDRHSHGCDSLRYCCIGFKTAKPRPQRSFNREYTSVGKSTTGWMSL